MSAPTPEITRKVSAIARNVRHSCSLKLPPPSAVTMWIGEVEVPRTASFEDFPTFLNAERPPILSSPFVDPAIPGI